MNGITAISGSLNLMPLNLIYGFCRKQVEENRRLILVTFVVSAAFAAVALAYRRLQAPQVIPFNRWDVSLGLSSQIGLTEDEASHLAETSQKYAPLEFARRLYAYMFQHQKNASSPENPRTCEQWLQWMCSSSRQAIVEKIQPILPSYLERHPMAQEDEKAHVIQTWAMSLQPLFAFFKDPLPWKELLQPIQSSPRLAYTILFYCLAPYAAKAIWEGAHDFLPSFILEAGARYLEHKGKIALAGLGLIVWLYYRMNQEKGMITNLTENYASSRKPHKALDRIPSYREGIDQLLRAIGQTHCGEDGANIIWYYDENTHSTFVEKIGDILGELTATGRVYENSDLFQYPQLKNLKVVQISLKQFLTEYRDTEAVFRGWNDTLKHLVKNPNALVVLTDIDVIKPFFLPSYRNTGKSEESPTNSHEASLEKLPGKILADLIFLSLKQGKFRCLIEFNEEDKTSMEKESKDFHLFTAIRSPDIQDKELEELCYRLYTAPDLSCSFFKEEIQNLFKHLAFFLSKSPLPPLSVIDILQNTLRAKSSSWRLNLKDPEKVQGIEKAEKALYEAQRLKGHLLQKLWLQRRLQEEDSLPLAQALLLTESILIPLYKNTITTAKDPFLMQPNLVDSMQKQYNQTFGPCTKQEEEKLKTLPERIKKEIKGQDAVIDGICKAVHSWRKVPPRDGKPLVLFFAGETSAGKSETATKLAYELSFTYGIAETAVKTRESNVRRINLNRKTQGGFLGWEKVKAEILCHLLDSPTSVIILEEWDKMGSEDKSCLLELLDGTQLYLGKPWGYSSTNGPYVDKSGAIFILTANIPMEAEQTVEKGIGACFSEGKEEVAKAFLSRIDAVFSFQIPKKAAAELVDKELDFYVDNGILPSDKRKSVSDRFSNIDLTDVRQLQREVREAISKELETAADQKE